MQIKDVNKKMIESQQSGGGCGCDRDYTNTESLLNAINNYFVSDNGHQVQSGGAFDTEYLINNIESQYKNQNMIDTESLLQNIEKVYGNQAQRGGAPKTNKTSGERKVKNNLPSRSSTLAQMVVNQANEIINRVVLQILDIMENNKSAFKGMKINEEMAKIYKAALWKKVTEENPDLKSALDKAVEMEKITNLETLKSFKPKYIKDLHKEIQEHYKQKEQKKKQREPEMKSEESSEEPSEETE